MLPSLTYSTDKMLRDAHQWVRIISRSQTIELSDVFVRSGTCFDLVNHDLVVNLDVDLWWLLLGCTHVPKRLLGNLLINLE